MKMKCKKLLVTLGLISLSKMALADPGFDMTVGFVNLTQDTITLKAISSSYCVTDRDGIFTGNSLTLQPGGSINTITNYHYNKISAKTSYVYTWHYSYECAKDSHRVTLQLSYPVASVEENFSFNLYIPTTHGSGTRGVLSFTDQEKGTTELNFQKSGQTTVPLPYNLQIQAANDALNPIIYIYPVTSN